jgi:class I fructose-bisphosphate aldolase
MNPTSLLLRNGHGMLLAYDQGFEHGPTDFNDRNIDPEYILKIAQDAGVFTGLVLQEGVAEKYWPKNHLTASRHYPPLLVKLNGKTSFHKGEEPYSPLLCTVDEAIRLGAQAVGYTIYVGSEHEPQMMKEFSLIEDQAHAKNLAVVAWMYPRGQHVKGKETTKDVVAYAARLGLELGADYVKLPYTGDVDSFKWVVKSAGKTKVFVQGGTKKTEAHLFNQTKDIIQAGAVGLAIGRNVWQHPEPVKIAQKLAKIIFK